MALNVNARHGSQVRDPYKNKQRYERWDKQLPGATEADTPAILQYLEDMEDGKNIGGPKGSRSPVRLMALKSRMTTLSRFADEHFKKTLLTITQDELHRLFKDMRTGKLKKSNGQSYLAVADYVKAYKSFWHWHQRRERKNGNHLLDITVDLDSSRDKPHFNYLTQDQIKLLGDAAKYEYRVLVWFLYDSGMRPTEMYNVRVCDLDFTKEEAIGCNIRPETSKTFGRKIKLLLCSRMLKEYISRKGLKDTAFIWDISRTKTGQYLKRLGKKVLNLPNLTMYDLRHSSACYWLSRYKQESAMKYRFGWEKSEMINYYTELLGMKDTISEDDLMDSEDKTQLQNELSQSKREQEIMQETLAAMQDRMRRMEEMINAGIFERAKTELRKRMSNT